MTAEKNGKFCSFRHLDEENAQNIRKNKRNSTNLMRFSDERKCKFLKKTLSLNSHFCSGLKIMPTCIFSLTAFLLVSSMRQSLCVFIDMRALLQRHICA